jgi:hypothetical protein
MAIEGTVQALLATVVSRCYPTGEVPDTPTAPYIVFQVISGVSATLLGDKKKRFQIDIYAAGYDAAKALETSLIAAMVAATFTNSFLVSRDAYDSESKLNRQIIDYYVWG